MKKYLVGGAVRDTLLNLPVQEKDWVITGVSPQEMIKIGYEQVGKEFPVFLHPRNHEEYALARTERKTGLGYTGFICHTDSSITIEEDLYRRDLTINAMAYDKKGNLIDPYHGYKDIQLKLLRHVSQAFQEDPLRILRVARFAARFAKMQFTIAPETFSLMKEMVHELPSLSPERIWAETKKALHTDSPQIFFQVLHHCGALKIIFPEIDVLFSVSANSIPQVPFPSKSIGHYTMKILANTVHYTNDLSVRFAILCHNIANRTDYNRRNHTDNQFFQNRKNLLITPIDTLCNKFRIDNKTCSFAKIVFRNQKYLQINNLSSPEKLMKLFHSFDCWRQPTKIDQIISFIKSKTLIPEYYSSIYYLEKFLYSAFAVTKKIIVKDIIKDGFIKSNISHELYSRRLQSLKTWQKQHNQQNHNNKEYCYFKDQ